MVALLHLGTQGVLRRRPRLPRPALVVGLLPWVVLLPLGLLLPAGWWTVRWVRRQPGRAAAGLERFAPWVIRAGPAVLLAWAVLDLVSDVRVLVGAGV